MPSWRPSLTICLTHFQHHERAWTQMNSWTPIMATGSVPTGTFPNWEIFPTDKSAWTVMSIWTKICDKWCRHLGSNAIKDHSSSEDKRGIKLLLAMEVFNLNYIYALRLNLLQTVWESRHVALVQENAFFQHDFFSLFKKQAYVLKK